MTITNTQFDDYTVVQIDGRIDTVTAPDFEKEMTNLLGSGISNLILDCSKLQYISSTGLRVFLILQKNLKPPKGNLKLCSLPAAIREIFDISGFSRIFTIAENMESAVQQN